MSCLNKSSYLHLISLFSNTFTYFFRSIFMLDNSYLTNELLLKFNNNNNNKKDTKGMVSDIFKILGGQCV